MNIDLSSIQSTLGSINSIDALLGLWLILAAFHGFAAGFIRMIGTIIGLIAGLVVAGWYYEGVTAWTLGYMPTWLHSFENWIQIGTFIVIFLVFGKVMGLIFEAVNTMFSIIPVVGLLNRLGGLLVSVAEAVLVIATILFVLSRYPVLAKWQTLAMQSTIAQNISNITPILEPLYPELLKQLPVLFDGNTPEFIQNMIDNADAEL